MWGKKRKEVREEKEAQPLEDDTNGGYIVVSIDQHKMKGETYWFEVHWKNYEQPTWEPFGKLRLNLCLIDYMKKQGRRDKDLLDWMRKKKNSWKRELERKLYQYLDEL